MESQRKAGRKPASKTAPSRKPLTRVASGTKSDEIVNTPLKPGRGRRRKAIAPEDNSRIEVTPKPVPRKRGRPPAIKTDRVADFMATSESVLSVASSLESSLHKSVEELHIICDELRSTLIRQKMNELVRLRIENNRLKEQALNRAEHEAETLIEELQVLLYGRQPHSDAEHWMGRAAKSAEGMTELLADRKNLVNRITELESEGQVYNELMEEMKKERDDIYAQYEELKQRRDKMRYLHHVPGEVGRTAKIYPTKYENVPAWVESNFPDQLILLPRAVRSLQNAKYQDVGKVCKCLELLATEYRLNRLGKFPQVVFDRKLKEMHLRYSKSISPERMGEDRDAYFVNYKTSTGSKQFLELHLRSIATTRQPERCLAIYFFWDEERQIVVIGSLPGHLDIRTSN